MPDQVLDINNSINAMRILVTILLGLVISTSVNMHAQAAETENQNSKQTSNSENMAESFEDNFLVAVYVPPSGNAASYKYLKSRLPLKSVLPKGTFIVNASAYTAAADECGKSDGITASGVKVQAKRTLACPPSYKFGTKVQIEGMGVYVCEDRGGAIKGNHFDIYMETKKEAFAFGRRNLVANVIE